VVDARLDGDAPEFAMAHGQEVHERISGLAPAGRSYRFEQLCLGLPIRRSGGTFAVAGGAAARE
jgi:hypothetical protein